MERGIINKLDRVLNKTLDQKKVFGAVVNIEATDGNFSWLKAVGNMKNGTPYAIASITKMFTTTVIIKMIEAGLLFLRYICLLLSI